MKSRRGEIIKVGDLFEKYKNVLRAPQSSVIKEVIEVIAELTGVTLSPKYLKYAVHSTTVSITAPAILKQEAVSAGEAICRGRRRQLFT